MPCCEARAAITLASTATVPTDRSMPPDMMTNAMPTEMSTNFEVLASTSETFCAPMKLS